MRRSGICKGCDLIMSKQLPDTPWHIGMPKMKESDHRRLNKWCVHYKESICKEPKSGCYMLKCGGSSHCRFYAENKKASEKIKRDTRTQMEIDAENRRKHIQSLKPKMQELVSSLDDRRYLPVRNLTKCYICGEKLLEFSGSRKQCTFCHMEYMDQVAWLADTRPMDGRFVYVMGREKPATATNSRKKERCRFCNNNGKCLDSNSALFRQRCDPEYCERLKKKYPDIKKLEVLKFTGVKYIPLSSMMAINMPKPKQSKIDSAAEEIRRNRGVTTPIYLGVYGDKYLIKEGYIWYLAACQCGLFCIPATLELENVRKK